MKSIDTIAAVATAWGEGAIGIIRISGPEALPLAQKVFSPAGKSPDIKERHLYYGLIRDGAGSFLDNALMAYMKAPASYTGEDVVEFFCHGGPLVLKNVLEAVLKAGARAAGPGEFTRQAFLNGKLDLAQAEAVIDIIRAATPASLSAAQGRLHGALSLKVKETRDVLFSLVTHLEAELDFEESEIEALPESAVGDRLDEAGSRLERLISSYEEGRVIKDGVRVLLLGRPNTGKSSLLNVLLQEERAIVTPVPGTTRDVIEEVVNIRGIPMRLMDTAGLRETVDEVEAIGVEAARARISQAGLIIFVIDSTSDDFCEDLELLAGLGDKKVVIAANKSDLSGGARQTVSDTFRGRNIRHISALYSGGIEELKDELFRQCAGRASGASETPAGELVTSARHKDCLDKALKAVLNAKAALKEGAAREFLATDIRLALAEIGGVTGETTTEEILDNIFGNFCIGK